MSKTIKEVVIRMVEAALSIVKGVCSNCAPPENPPKKICMMVTIDGKQVLFCKDCVRLIMGKIEDIEKMEQKGIIKV